MPVPVSWHDPSGVASMASVVNGGYRSKRRKSSKRRKTAKRSKPKPSKKKKTRKRR